MTRHAERLFLRRAPVERLLVLGRPGGVAVPTASVGMRPVAGVVGARPIEAVLTCVAICRSPRRRS